MVHRLERVASRARGVAKNCHRGVPRTDFAQGRPLDCVTWACRRRKVTFIYLVEGVLICLRGGIRQLPVRMNKAAHRRGRFVEVSFWLAEMKTD